MTARATSSGLRVVMVGATSLKGKELKELLEERLFPLKNLRLLDDVEALGRLTEFSGEPAVVETVTAGTFAETDLIFFASTAGEFTRSHWQQAATSSAAVIDLSHALLDVPEAVVRVPFLEKECLPSPRYDHPWFIAPHAAAIVLLTLLGRLLARFRVRRVVASVFEPVSERGASGLEELHEQTVRLLSFKEFPREVFDAQVAFNLLPHYGEHSATRLEEVESTIVREIERAHPAAAGPLALRVIQVPVFHCHTVSLLVELEEPVEIAVMEEALRGDRLAVRGHRESPMAAVDVAGQEEIVVGPVRRDFKCRNAFWLWAAADNLRLPARTGVDIAETLLP